MTNSDATSADAPAANPARRPPPWIREEVILACAIHVQNQWRRLDYNHPDVLELSRLLKMAPYHDVAAYSESFRNNYSVSRKTSDLKTANPGYDPEKVQMNGGKTTEAVLMEFLEDTPGMLVEAAKIRASLTAVDIIVPQIPVELGVHPVPVEPAPRMRGTTTRIKRIESRSDAVRRRYAHTCQICRRAMRGAGGTVTSQGAHFRALQYGGPDHSSNIGCLCGFCHAEYDAGGIYIDGGFIVRDSRTHSEEAKLYVVPDHVIDTDHFRYHRASFGLDSHPEFPPMSQL
jgi:5-methylcytosine-specific restriction protein A